MLKYIHLNIKVSKQ